MWNWVDLWKVRHLAIASLNRDDRNGFGMELGWFVESGIYCDRVLSR